MTMTTPGSKDRIRVAIAETANRIALDTPRGGVGLPAPGDLYVFSAEVDAALEWLIVRFHPDDAETVLLAPADDFPLAGTPDVVLDAESLGRPLTIRCGETDWFPTGVCSSRLRTGAVPEWALGLVRRRLADLARGRTLAAGDTSVDFDPEYDEWMSIVERSRCSLLARAQRGKSESGDVISLASFIRATPPQLVVPSELSLAAETGSTLLAELGKAAAEPGDLRYFEVTEIQGGKLFLQADAIGVRGFWEGSPELAPKMLEVNSLGEELEITWLTVPRGQLHRTERNFRWIDGRIELVIGTLPRRRFAIQL